MDEGKTIVGIFTVNSKTGLSGSLSLKGPASELHLWYSGLLDLRFNDKQIVTGDLDNGEKVSLIDCVYVKGHGLYGVVPGGTQHDWYFPYYAVIGRRVFSPSENSISKVSFVLDDAGILFHDRKSYGTLWLEAEEVENLKSIGSFSRIPFTADPPIIAYFTGKREIFAAETTVGRISAINSHSAGHGGDSGGAYIKNQIRVSIEFDSPLNIHEMDRRLQKTMRFFEIIVGRPQRLVEVNVKHVDDDNKTPLSTAYINTYPNPDRHTDDSKRHHHSVLINAVEQPEKFVRLINGWMKRDEMWNHARMRFSWGWRKQRSYDADRIVGAANMFDLMPNDALPVEFTLPYDLEAAVRDCNLRIKRLPQSSERDAVLNALGRIRKPSLKKKIRHRAARITDVIGSLVPEIDFVTDRAVDLRNRYVHGDKSGRQEEGSGHSLIFMTNTLEFVFCVSDLVESGWDLGAWVQQDKIPAHPFESYISNYKQDLSELKSECS